MPRVNVYLTDEAFEYWKDLENKSAWLQERLLDKKVQAKISAPTLKDEAIAEPILRIDAIPKSERFDGPLCKIHGLPLDSRGKCLQKGCRYA